MCYMVALYQLWLAHAQNMHDGSEQACESNDIDINERTKENANRNRRLLSHELQLGHFKEKSIQLLLNPLASQCNCDHDESQSSFTRAGDSTTPPHGSWSERLSAPAASRRQRPIITKSANVRLAVSHLTLAGQLAIWHSTMP